MDGNEPAHVLTPAGAVRHPVRPAQVVEEAGAVARSHEPDDNLVAHVGDGTGSGTALGATGR